MDPLVIRVAIFGVAAALFFHELCGSSRGSSRGSLGGAHVARRVARHVAIWVARTWLALAPD